MDEKTMELVSIATSVAGHCRTCFEYHFQQAKKLGVTMDDINEVVKFTNRISGTRDKAMFKFVLKQLKEKKEVIT